MAVTMGVLVMVWVAACVSVSVLMVVDTFLSTLATVGREKVTNSFHGSILHPSKIVFMKIFCSDCTAIPTSIFMFLHLFHWFLYM